MEGVLWFHESLVGDMGFVICWRGLMDRWVTGWMVLACLRCGFFDSCALFYLH